jgi:glycosyltransferase involved in cell wall biosynthesis
MKIFHFVAWFYPGPPGGSEAYVAAISRRMQQVGCDVTVIAPKPGIDGMESYGHEGVCVVRYPIPQDLTRPEVQGSTPWRGMEDLHRCIRRERPDIAHFHTFSTGIGLPEVRVARAVGARVFATCHFADYGYLCKRSTMMRWGDTQCDGIAEPVKCAECVLSDRLPRFAALLVSHFQLPLAALPERLRATLGLKQIIVHDLARHRELLDLCDTFFVPTQWGAEIMIANGAPPAKIRVVRVGLAHDRLSIKPGPDERPTERPVRIGYFGRIERIKGVLDLARAFAAVPKDAPLRLDFCGPVREGDSAAVAREARAILSGDPRVIFSPPVAPHDAPAVLSRYDVLCCPSVWVEAGPMVALEAFACGTPVIGSRIGGLADIVQCGVSGELVEAGDWRALSSVLKHIADDPRATVDFWRRNVPTPHTMQDVADEYVSIYRSVMSSQKHAALQGH